MTSDMLKCRLVFCCKNQHILIWDASDICIPLCNQSARDLNARTWSTWHHTEVVRVVFPEQQINLEYAPNEISATWFKCNFPKKRYHIHLCAYPRRTPVKSVDAGKPSPHTLLTGRENCPANAIQNKFRDWSNRQSVPWKLKVIYHNWLAEFNIQMNNKPIFNPPPPPSSASRMNLLFPWIEYQFVVQRNMHFNKNF